MLHFLYTYGIPLLLCIACGFAMRGKGGLFVTLGIFKKGSSSWLGHGLGGAIVAFAVCIALKNPFWFPALVPLWILFTKPSPSPNFVLIDATTTSARIKGLLLSTVRQATIMPVIWATYIAAHGYHLDTLHACILGGFSVGASFVMTWPYYVGGVLLNGKYISDGVEFAEWWTLIAGVLFYLTIYVL